MTSIFQKARTLVLSNVHTLLDAAIDLNSISAIRQHVRDLEDARNDIADEAAIAGGRANRLKEQIREKELVKETTERNIDLLLGDGDPSNDHHAMPLAESLMAIDEDVTAFKAEREVQEYLARQLDEAHLELTSKHGEMLRNLRQLESMERTSAAREKAAGALSQAAAVAGSANQASVDNVAERLHDRDAVSKQRFERALQSVGDNVAEDAVKVSKAAAFIAARRSALDKKPLKKKAG